MSSSTSTLLAVLMLLAVLNPCLYFCITSLLYKLYFNLSLMPAIYYLRRNRFSSLILPPVNFVTLWLSIGYLRTASILMVCLEVPIELRSRRGTGIWVLSYLFFLLNRCGIIGLTLSISYLSLNLGVFWEPLQFGLSVFKTLFFCSHSRLWMS